MPEQPPLKSRFTASRIKILTRLDGTLSDVLCVPAVLPIGIHSDAAHFKRSFHQSRQDLQ